MTDYPICKGFDCVVAPFKWNLFIMEPNYKTSLFAIHYDNTVAAFLCNEEFIREARDNEWLAKKLDSTVKNIGVSI